MEIKWQWGACVYSISIGKKTDWYESSYFIGVERLWYDNKEVSYAELLYHT